VLHSTPALLGVHLYGCAGIASARHETAGTPTPAGAGAQHPRAPVAQLQRAQSKQGSQLSTVP